MSTAVIIQARMGSTRLPGKVLLPLSGKPMLARIIERARLIPGVDTVCVAIPTGPEQAAIAQLVGTLPDVHVVTGPEHDVLQRYLIAADACGAERIMRMTSDCPFIDPRISGAVLAAHDNAKTPCARTAFDKGVPQGLDTEVVTVEALRVAAQECDDPYEREHVTPFLWRRPNRFPAVFLGYAPDRRDWRLTVDEAPDYELAKQVYDALYSNQPDFGLAELETLFASRPELLRINAHVRATSTPLGPPSYG